MKTKYKSDFERKVAKVLRKKGKVQYEALSIPFTIYRTYLPDFRVQWLREGIFQTTFVETKGYFSPEDRQKMLAVKHQHPDYDIRLLFLQDNKLSKRSKTRYSDWARQHEFIYAIKEIPKEWFSRDDPISKWPKAPAIGPADPRGTTSGIEGCSPSVLSE